MKETLTLGNQISHGGTQSKAPSLPNWEMIKIQIGKSDRNTNLMSWRQPNIHLVALWNVDSLIIAEEGLIQTQINEERFHSVYN